MITYAYCYPDGDIYSVRREEKTPEDPTILKMILPEGSFLIDLTGKESFDILDILEIHTNYKADTSKQKLIRKT